MLIWLKPAYLPFLSLPTCLHLPAHLLPALPRLPACLHASYHACPTMPAYHACALPPPSGTYHLLSILFSYCPAYHALLSQRPASPVLPPALATSNLPYAQHHYCHYYYSCYYTHAPASRTCHLPPATCHMRNINITTTTTPITKPNAPAACHLPPALCVTPSSPPPLLLNECAHTYRII